MSSSTYVVMSRDVMLMGNKVRKIGVCPEYKKAKKKKLQAMQSPLENSKDMLVSLCHRRTAKIKAFA